MFSFVAVFLRSFENMSSQDSEGESCVADLTTNPRYYGDVEHYGWTSEEEEDYYPR